MEDPESNDLLAISIDPDNYADAATTSNNNQSRTYQSEAAFQEIKATYKAKIDHGNTYQDLIAAVPVLVEPVEPLSDPAAEGSESGVKVKLSKKDVQLLGYAVAGMYYDREYGRVIELCRRVVGRCEVDGKVGESLGRWVERCEGRISMSGGG